MSRIVELDEDDTILEEAIRRYGNDMQTTVAIEELSELQKELCKAIRGKFHYEHMAEEIADVYIMLEQIEMIYGIDLKDIVVNIELKKERLRRTLNGREG